MLTRYYQVQVEYSGAEMLAVWASSAVSLREAKGIARWAVGELKRKGYTVREARVEKVGGRRASRIRLDV